MPNGNLILIWETLKTLSAWYVFGWPRNPVSWRLNLSLIVRVIFCSQELLAICEWLITLKQATRKIVSSCFIWISLWRNFWLLDFAYSYSQSSHAFISNLQRLVSRFTFSGHPEDSLRNRFTEASRSAELHFRFMLISKHTPQNLSYTGRSLRVLQIPWLRLWFMTSQGRSASHRRSLPPKFTAVHPNKHSQMSFSTGTRLIMISSPRKCGFWRVRHRDPFVTFKAVLTCIPYTRFIWKTTHANL